MGGGQEVCTMKFYKGMKCVTAEAFTRQTNITGFSIVTEHGALDKHGMLSVNKWFPWDGNSGPVPNWKSTIEASAVHDILCNWINDGLLPVSIQPMVDQEYYNICVEHGLWGWIARLRLTAIRWHMLRRKKLYRRPVYEA